VGRRLETLRHSRWKNRREESARERERTSEIRIREKERKRITKKAEKGKKEREPLLHPPPLENVFTPLNTSVGMFVLMSASC